MLEKHNYLIKLFEKSEISLGQLANALGLTKKETMIYLEKFNIPFTDYDLKEDLENIDRFID